MSFVVIWQVEKAHDADLHCVDWNPHDVNLILTGYLYNLSSCMFILSHETDSMRSVFMLLPIVWVKLYLFYLLFFSLIFVPVFHLWWTLACLWFMFPLLRSADNSVHLFDRRNLNPGGVGTPVHKFEGHSAAVLCVQVWKLFCLLAQFLIVFYLSQYKLYLFSVISDKVIVSSGLQINRLSLALLQRMAF